MLADPAIPAKAKNTTLIPAAQKKITACERDVAAATARRKTLRAKIPRNQLHPGAQRAILRPGRRAITRETILRGLGGTITYAPAAITVTLDPPGQQPRVTRALTCLLAKINQNPPVIPGDHRPITYQLAGT
jgi:hypothetical protein